MKRILVIDDEHMIRIMLRKILEKAGYAVEEAANGNEGIRVFEEKGADVIITDLVMPDKEGIETIMELKKKHPDIRIIAISGGGRAKPENYLAIAKAMGIRHAFAKPVEKEDLLKAVAELCG